MQQQPFYWAEWQQQVAPHLAQVHQKTRWLVWSSVALFAVLGLTVAILISLI